MNRKIIIRIRGKSKHIFSRLGILSANLGNLITLPKCSGLEIADSYVFTPAEFKNHHKNYQLAFVLEKLSLKTTKRPFSISIRF